MGPRLSIRWLVPSFRPLAHFHHIGSVSGHLFAAANRESSKPPTRMKERFERAAKRWEDEVRKDLKYITFDLREVADTVDRLRSGVVAMVANGFESACLPSAGSWLPTNPTARSSSNVFGMAGPTFCRRCGTISGSPVRAGQLASPSSSASTCARSGASSFAATGWTHLTAGFSDRSLRISIGATGSNRSFSATTILRTV